MDYDNVRLMRVKSILKELSLDKGIVEKLENLNSRSNNHPYHNIQHLFTVAIRSFDGSKYYNLEKDHTQAIVLAALCHDADYIVGESESVNLVAAKEVLRQISPEHLFEKAQRYIDATEFPHNKAECLASSIIQDADMMQGFEKDAYKFLNGLCIEKNDPTIADPKFPGVQGFNTSWGKELYLSYFPVKEKINMLS